MTLRVMVVDDEPLARDELRFLLGQCERVAVVWEAGDAARAKEVCAARRPDVAFLDLRMPDIDGIALAQLLRRRRPDLDVVIVSAHDEGALRGFEIRITDYLLKPVRLARLQQTLDRVLPAEPCSSIPPTRFERFAVRRKGSFVVVDLRDVVYFETRDELVWAVTERDRFALDVTLAGLARQLDPVAFFQSHRSCIIRVDRIRTIHRSGARTFRLVLDHPDDPSVPLARDRASQLRERIPFSR